MKNPPTQRIPLTRPMTGEEESLALRRVVESGWMTMGPEVLAFETEFAEAVGAPHACAVSSGTAAIYLALRAAGVEAGDEVVTVSHTFIATSDAIRFCGALPVYVDIDPGTFNMAPQLIEQAVTERTKAILCVHQMGMPADMGAILAVAGRRGLPVIEDAACALGSEIRVGDGWEALGRPHGDAACFSFHPRKTLTTGDGGMITTRHMEWDRRFRLLRQHGMSVQAHDRHTAPRVVFESYEEHGFNFRLTDLQAALGRVQLTRLPEMVRLRRALAKRCHERLEGLSQFQRPAEPEWARSNWQSYAVRLADSLDQRAVMDRLLEQGIGTRRGIMCCHREPAYPPGTWRAASALVESERAQDRCVLLPLFPGLSHGEQDRVIEALLSICRA